eukprot:13547505-Alexandrium_andersonii.AAC.1
MSRQPGQPVGVFFGEGFVQIGNWRIGLYNDHHLSVQHEDGFVNVIYRDDGASFLSRGELTEF